MSVSAAPVALPRRSLPQSLRQNPLQSPRQTLRQTLRQSLRRRLTRPRRGRLLVECCVASLLLATSATAVLLMGTTSAMLVNGAAAQDVVHRTLVSQNAALHAQACRTDAISISRALGARYQILASDAPVPDGREEDLRVTWRESALHASGITTHEHRASGAARCE